MAIESEQSKIPDILIVDDVPDNLRLLSDILTRQGYSVRKAIRGQLALIAAKTLTPDLILLDVNLPDLNGYEVCQQLKADSTTAPIPIIFLSAGNEVVDRVRAFQAGGADYITKPFQLEEVLVRVRTQLTIQKLQLDLAEQIQLQQSSSLTSTDPVLREGMLTFKKMIAEVTQDVEEPLHSILENTVTAHQKLQSILQSIKTYREQNPTEIAMVQGFLKRTNLETILVTLSESVEINKNELIRVQSKILELKQFSDFVDSAEIEPE